MIEFLIYSAIVFAIFFVLIFVLFRFGADLKLVFAASLVLASITIAISSVAYSASSAIKNHYVEEPEPKPLIERIYLDKE